MIQDRCSYINIKDIVEIRDEFDDIIEQIRNARTHVAVKMKNLTEYIISTGVENPRASLI